ncbi:MAG: phosphoribosylglycinamide formyltransferase [Chitinophagales bacterium]|nr:phosphoribosylglycinamide formyltransferase [Chitinophagales bacterium]
MKKLAIFASGTGSNAAKIIDFFSVPEKQIQVALIVCNNSNAGVLQIASKNFIPTLIIHKEQFINGNAYLPQLKQLEIDFIVLAGFLWKIPQKLIEAFPNKIINIHPALLPKYGGKGMYGDNVHKAVIENKETQSGITIHFVNEQYDEGEIIFQTSCNIDEKDTAKTLAKKIHELEHKHFSKVIEQIISK